VAAKLPKANTDGGIMADESAAINPLIANVQKALIDLIDFTKKRQWAITNYSVLVYAGIFGVAHSFGTSIRPGEKWR